MFFDEVQAAPNVVTLSKYLVQDGRFDLAMSGSLLGIELQKVRSLPVGYLHTLCPIEVKSGKTYKRHVALDNLLSSKEYGIGRAYVLSEANVKMERRTGGTVCYLPLYMLPFIAEEARGTRLSTQHEDDVDWDSLLRQ